MQAFRGESSEVGEFGELESRLASGEFDLVAVGRALLADAHWVEKVRTGHFSELQPFSPKALATLA